MKKYIPIVLSAVTASTLLVGGKELIKTQRENEELKQNFEPNQSYYKVNANDTIEFLKYELRTYVSNYAEFENKISKCYDMLQYCKEKQIYGYVILIVYNDYWGGCGQSEEKLDYESFIAKMKNDYIKYLVDKNLSTSGVPIEDIEKYYKPETLQY